MRRVIIEASCDLHKDQPAAGDAIIIVGKAERLVDLCVDCLEVVKALHASGVLPSQVVDRPAQAKRAGPEQGVEYDARGVRVGFVDDGLSCPYDTYHAPTRPALGAHLKHSHALGFRELAAAGLVKSQMGQRT